MYVYASESQSAMSNCSEEKMSPYACGSIHVRTSFNGDSTDQLEYLKSLEIHTTISDDTQWYGVRIGRVKQLAYFISYRKRFWFL